jgi:hypothetical protein
MPETLDLPSPEAKDWGAVRFLTRQVEQTDRLAAAIHQWDLTVRLFRAVERQQFYEKEPTENDRQNHRALLHLLIGLGRVLELQAAALSDSQLATVGVTRADLRAYIEDLEDSFFLWYVPDFEPDKTAELQRAIFGADT